MKAGLDSLSSRQKLVLILLAALIVGSVLCHNHPRMDGLQAELESKAPALFKLFIVGEAIYFAGMVLMAVGLGTSLGPNITTWPAKLKEMMSSEGQTLANARAFWLGFLCNVLGSMTFGGIGIYVAAEILPSGAATLIPAAMVDMGFSLFVRYAFYRRFSRPRAAA